MTQPIEPPTTPTPGAVGPPPGVPQQPGDPKKWIVVGVIILGGLLAVGLLLLGDDEEAVQVSADAFAAQQVCFSAGLFYDEVGNCYSRDVTGLSAAERAPFRVAPPAPGAVAAPPAPVAPGAKPAAKPKAPSPPTTSKKAAAPSATSKASTPTTGGLAAAPTTARPAPPPPRPAALVVKSRCIEWYDPPQADRDGFWGQIDVRFDAQTTPSTPPRIRVRSDQAPTIRESSGFDVGPGLVQFVIGAWGDGEKLTVEELTIDGVKRDTDFGTYVVPGSSDC